MRRLTYLVGEPGAGKSELVLAAMAPFLLCEVTDGRVPYLDYRHPDGTQACVEPGRQREAFRGTDALSLGIMTQACEWVASHPAERIVAEGDRLSSERFWRAAEDAGYEVALVHVDPGEDEAKLRRHRRGSHQDLTWVRGRQTRVRRIVAARQPKLNLRGVEGDADALRALILS